jgi:hypothetical protein
VWRNGGPSAAQRAFGSVTVFRHVFPHELPNYLRSRLVLAATGVEELVAQSFLKPDANASAFDSHG